MAVCVNETFVTPWPPTLTQVPTRGLAISSSSETAWSRSCLRGGSDTGRRAGKQNIHGRADTTADDGCGNDSGEDWLVHTNDERMVGKGRRNYDDGMPTT